MIMMGFFLTPTLSYACGMKSEKYCSEKTSTTTKEMDCCKNDSHPKDKSNNGCNGKCGHSNCVTTSNQFNAVFFEIKFNTNNFDFSEKKQNYFNSNNNLSSGFYSIWLIPKIG